MTNFHELEKTEMFHYLDTLRETGVVNMFGATPYVQEAFDLTRAEAKAILKEWMETYGKR
jgi:hypothetical protein